MSKINTSDTRTVRVKLGDGEDYITVADLLELADHLRDIQAPADTKVYRVQPSVGGVVTRPVALHVDFPRETA